MFLLLPPFRDGALNHTVTRLTPQVFRNAIEMLWQVDIKNVTVPKFRIEENYDMSDVSGDRRRWVEWCELYELVLNYQEVG